MPLIALVVAAGLVLGLVSGVFGSLARQGLAAAGIETRSAVSAGSPGAPASSTGAPGSVSPTAVGSTSAATPVPGPTTSAPMPAPVLAGTEGAGTTSASALAARVAAVKVKDSGGYSGEVRDLRSGKVLFSHRAGTGEIPASTTKLVTSAAALDLLGAEHRFSTSVVAPAKGRVVLVGGGDPYLLEKGSKAEPTRASLSTLAKRTAVALKADGVTTVALGYDASRFSGPAWSPDWPASYGDVASRVSALWVNEGRSTPGGGVTGPRQTDPA